MAMLGHAERRGGGAARRRAWLGAALAASFVAATTAAAQNGPRSEPPVVVELFTSQGCAMCPPADALLAELDGRDGVIALTFNVTYWDYLGWRDSFGREEHSARQHAYADAHRSRPVYTPQIIVQGGWSVIGNRRHEVEQAIAEARLRTPAAVVSLDRDGDVLRIDLAPTGAGMDGAEVCRVLVVGFDGPHETHIGRGENSGRTITYHNVVREMRDIGEWRGAARTVTVEIDPAMRGYAVLLQGEEHGPVFAAGVIEF